VVQAEKAIPTAPGTAASAGTETGGNNLGHKEAEDPRAVIARFVGANPVPEKSPSLEPQGPVEAAKTRGIEEQDEEKTEDDPLA
jgi:hypothetical protein